MKKITTILMLLMLSMGATAQVHVTKTGSDFLTETQLKDGVGSGDFYVSLQQHQINNHKYINSIGKIQDNFDANGTTTWKVEKNGSDYVLKSVATNKYIASLGSNTSTTAVGFTDDIGSALKFNPRQSTSTDGNAGTGFTANQALQWDIIGGSNRINSNAGSNYIFQNSGVGIWTCIFTYEVTIKSTVDITFNITGDATKNITKTVASDATGDIAELLGYETEFVTFEPATYNAAEVTTVNVTCTQNLPFKTDGTIYNMTLKGKYAKGNNLVSTVEGDALYYWTFTGDYLNGFKIFNVGQGKYIKQEDVDNSVAQFVDESEATTYFLMKSTSSTGNYCMKIMDSEKNFLNNRSDKLSTWKANPNNNVIGDDGSGMNFTEKPFKDLVDILVKPWINNIGSGYFTLDGNNEDVKALQDAYNNHTADTWTKDEYNNLVSLLDAAKASDGAFKMPVTGYYLIKNTRYSQYVGFGTSSNQDQDKGDGLILYSAICPATVLKLVKKDGNKYTVSSQGLFGKQFPTNANDQLLPFTNVEGDAKEFTFTPVDGNGNVAISTEPYPNPNNSSMTIGYWHGTTWDGVVSWEKDADPSWFTVEDAIGKSFNITMNAVGGKYYATTCLPFPVVLSEAAAYTVKVNGKQAEYTLAGSEIPAGEAVLLISDNSETLTATVQNVTTTVGENALLGVYAKTAAANLENPTVLNAVGEKIGFYRLDATSTLSANRAYLNYAVPEGAKEGFDLVDANETTGVESIDNAQFAIDNAPVYNLQGQRVNKAQKGVFIQNGKKVVVK